MPQRVQPRLVSITLHRVQLVPAGGRCWRREEADGLTVDQAVDLMASGPEITLVAETDEGIVGMVAGAAIGAVGWIGRLAVAPEGAGVEVAHRLLDRLAARLVEEGARTLLTVLGEAHESTALLIRAGFSRGDALGCLKGEIPATVAAPAALARLGGRMIEPALWDQLRGMEQAKAIIERRVILPLAEPQLAARHAVAPPACHRAVRTPRDRQDHLRERDRLQARMALC